jgi:hypothetical protein
MIRYRLSYFWAVLALTVIAALHPGFRRPRR